MIQTTNKKIVELNIKTIDDVRQKGKDLVGFSAEVKKLNSELKRFLFATLYRHYRVERMAEKAQRVISQLFQAYMKNPRTLPPDFKNQYDLNETTARIVCDYIAGMTDRYALDEYAKLFDPYSKV